MIPITLIIIISIESPNHQQREKTATYLIQNGHHIAPIYKHGSLNTKWLLRQKIIEQYSPIPPIWSLPDSIRYQNGQDIALKWYNHNQKTPETYNTNRMHQATIDYILHHHLQQDHTIYHKLQAMRNNWQQEIELVTEYYRIISPWANGKNPPHHITKIPHSHQHRTQLLHEINTHYKNEYRRRLKHPGIIHYNKKVYWTNNWWN